MEINSAPAIELKKHLHVCSDRRDKREKKKKKEENASSNCIKRWFNSD